MSVSIGQGPVLVTVVQLARAFAMLANGGRPVTPHLVSPQRAPRPEPGVSPENLALVDAALEEVVHGPRGTARRLGAIPMAGKTGTAQVINIAQNAVYNEEEVDERHRHHGLFIAFAPLDKPTIAVAIIVENGGGSSAAAPIARAVIDTWLPKGSADG